MSGNRERWIWKASKGGDYTTKSAYSAIKASRNESTSTISNSDTLASIWTTTATHKAKVTAWRILRSRLPTCDNLRKRNVPLGVEEMTCNSCFHSPESVEHVFLTCPKTVMVWNRVKTWIGSRPAHPQGIDSHFYTFTHLDKGKNCENFLKALWICTTWLIWKRRNETRFEGKQWSIDGLILEIQARTWSWNKVFMFSRKDFSFRDWSSNELLAKLL
ncbi:uncharacterized protein LOC131018929 [Salvia miltiorrhiza]|uniref:uncharacterized protein LOC131018929 n=1 Tax=Salvia miltiorrhiza TaxID=226208 RepID=UPI0025ACA548|nr:uncharacterized protein LOC131018929 [Salvia miltiorrhiza]